MTNRENKLVKENQLTGFSALKPSNKNLSLRMLIANGRLSSVMLFGKHSSFSEAKMRWNLQETRGIQLSILYRESEETIPV